MTSSAVAFHKAFSRFREGSAIYAPDMGTTQSWIMRRLRISFFLLESWVELIQYLGICLSYELILNQFPGKPIESRIDLNQYLGICLSRELILNQFPGKPFESWVDSESIPWKAIWVMSLIDSTIRDTSSVMSCFGINSREDTWV